MKKKKIIKSLKRIKKFCKGRPCITCPIYNGTYGCLLINHIPDIWDIEDISKRFKKEEQRWAF